jgi:hypothetical protein
MPSYKIDILLRHPETGQEERLEQELQAKLYGLGVVGITGITAYQVYPNE